jgi:hypothetical protein
MEPTDQNQEVQTQETKETNPEVNQEVENQDKSNKGASETELFELPDGRKVDAATLSKEWKENFMPEFTKRSQTLAEIERKEKESKEKIEIDSRNSVNNNEILKDVPLEVKEAIHQIVKPLFQEYDKAKSAEIETKRQDERFESELSSLETKWDGKDGKPKFDRNEVISAMKDPNNRNFDPESKFRELHQQEFLDNLIKESLKKQSGGGNLENTGTEGEHKPDPKSPKTFKEAAERFASRL